MSDPKIYITECPRDAMQGWKNMISTEKKIEYIKQLMKVGYDVLDFGSYVNPKVMPQMADTPEVLQAVQEEKGDTKLLAIIANMKGAEQAASQPAVDILGFPFSISETFQQRNTNKSISESFEQVKLIQELAESAGKKLLIYISMGFGNPYNDPYSPSIVGEWIGRLAGLGITQFALSDTVGVSQPALITSLFRELITGNPHLKIGAHFHTTPDTAWEKIHAAYEAGCRYFDTSVSGIGGCPMAKDELVGNLSTESVISYIQAGDMPHGLDLTAFEEARLMSQKVFV